MVGASTVETPQYDFDGYWIFVRFIRRPIYHFKTYTSSRIGVSSRSSNRSNSYLGWGVYYGGTSCHDFIPMATYR